MLNSAEGKHGREKKGDKAEKQCIVEVFEFEKLNKKNHAILT